MSRPIRPKEIIKQRNRRLIAVTVLIMVAGFCTFGYGWFINRNWVATDDAFVSGHLIIVKALTEGSVTEVLAENTQQVQQGQVLFRLDGTQAKLRLQQAQAELGEQVRAIAALQANITMLTQRKIAKQAAVSLLKHDLQRFREAAKEGAVSVQQVQNAQDRLRQLQAEIAAIDAEQSGVQAQLLGDKVHLHPSVEKAKNRLRQAYLEYHRREVKAPVGGYVAKRKAQIGDQVKAGTPLLVIVPLQALWVEANVLETKVVRVRPGQSAEINVDAFGDEFIYHGTVVGINPGTGSAFALLPTDNSSGNFIHIAERVPVRIALDAKELKQHPLQPGLSTLTRIKVDEPGKAVMMSSVTTDNDVYRTDIFNHELEGVEALIDEIIAENM